MPEQTPTTLSEAWKLHPTRRSELSALLREPALIDALSILREKAFEPRPIPPAAVQGSVSLMEWSALTNQRREGYLDCLSNLLGLARISVFKAPETPPWTSQGKEEKIKALEAALHIPEDTRLPNSPVKAAPAGEPPTS